ncbi:CTP pyrophosphohydrolase [Caloramator mitchellensis]|uniref:8-oxo-dGTP diphosphatase n=1 Tax=Caloramator mitchellensis TaxID=908809 RepID=A0A0R3JSZ0_CALMK|nr:(deoxy)nucleoside triphosphate pyrophosphohydrolase [Caloramator mitchellensis]KRQ86106.1 CTP pyrophosphohydrolase [Caloramator mitchellensis]
MKEVTAAIIIEDDKVLIAKRKDGNIKGKWEFPGGKVEKGESYEDCLIREIKEELNIEIEIIKHYQTNIHTYDNGVIKLIAFIAKAETFDFVLSVHDEIKWVDASELLNFDLAPADIPIAEQLIKDINNNIL